VEAIDQLKANHFDLPHLDGQRKPKGLEIQSNAGREYFHITRRLVDQLELVLWKEILYMSKFTTPVSGSSDVI
jgi:hypothetical protein